MEPTTSRAEAESTKSNANGNTNSNNRLQQSCTKCRERKIKCDRKNPCRACISRGCQDQCEYVRTDDDRYHISQAKEIESLRKELNKLKRRLADTEQQQAKEPAAVDDGYGYVAPGTSSSSSSIFTEPPPKRRLGAPSESASMIGDQLGNLNWGFPDDSGVDFASSGSVLQDNFFMPAAVPNASQGSGTFDATSMSVMGYGGFQSAQLAENQLFYSIEQQRQGYHPSSSNFTNPLMTATTPPNQHYLHANPTQSLHNQLQQHPQTDFWRGKHKILQRIYKIVCDCDDLWVPTIIEIVRTSISPEEAMLSIQGLLMRSHSMSSSNHNDANTVMAAPTTTSSRSPDSASSIAPVEMDSVSYRGGGTSFKYAENVSPSMRSRSSGEE